MRAHTCLPVPGIPLNKRQLRKMAEQVQKLEAESKAGAKAANGANAAAAATATPPAPAVPAPATTASASAPPATPPTRPRRVTAEVLYAYVAADADELSLQAGEKVDVLLEDRNAANGWSVGRNSSGQTGLFPLAHVRMPSA